MTTNRAQQMALLIGLAACCIGIAACGGGGSSASDAPLADATVQDGSTPSANTPASAAASGTESTASVSTTPLRDSPWGVAPSASLARAPEVWASEVAAAGVTSVRNFNAATAPDHLKPLTDLGITVSGILQWSPPTSAATLPVSDINGWRNYVTGMVARYKGKIHHWEVWNEPSNYTSGATPIAYGALVAVAYDAAKAVDPTVQIGLAAKGNHINWLAQSIEAGAANKFDFITVHPYENAALLAQGWEGQFMSIAPRIRSMLLDKNPAKAGVPVWFTEVGVQVATSTTSGVTPAAQADALVKIFTMAIAQGVARTYWFSPRDGEGMSLGLSAADGTKRASYFALRTLSNFLGLRPNFLGWVQPGGAYYGFVFEGPQGTATVAWAPTGRSSTLTLPAAVNVVDPRTGAARSASSIVLTDVPVLLVATANSIQSRDWRLAAAANTGKAFAWFGDHGGAASVSLTAGSEPQGVVMVAPPPTTVVNGVAEFSIAGRSATSFVVDPTFLSYTTTPIRITIVLRAQGTGAPGFNLKYESSAALARADGNGLVASSSGWYQVGSTSFYERTWTLLDPRFVGLYGYNFTLDSDGPTHSQFSIHKVTVSKL